MYLLLDLRSTHTYKMTDMSLCDQLHFKNSGFQNSSRLPYINISHVSLWFQVERPFQRRNVGKPVCDLSCLYLHIIFPAVLSQYPLLYQISAMRIVLL